MCSGSQVWLGPVLLLVRLSRCGISGSFRKQLVTRSSLLPLSLAVAPPGLVLQPPVDLSPSACVAAPDTSSLGSCHTCPSSVPPAQASSRAGDTPASAPPQTPAAQWWPASLWSDPRSQHTVPQPRAPGPSPAASPTHLPHTFPAGRIPSILRNMAHLSPSQEALPGHASPPTRIQCLL